MTQITAPVAQPGDVETYFGSQRVVFRDGVAELDFELNDGLRAYLVGAGYGLDGGEVTVEVPAQPDDPRDFSEPTPLGTPLRDAAVDPRDTDFLAPTNAGEANPHGQLVVSPGIHGTGPGPIVPGTVGSTDYQNAKETEVAEMVLVDQESAADVIAAVKPVADAEYQLTQDKGANAGLARGLDEMTAEERELIGEIGDDPVDEEIEQVNDENQGDQGDQGDTPAPAPDAESATGDQGDVQDAEGAQGQTEAPADAETPVEDLKGDALTEALRSAGLATTGSAAEKRARLAEYRETV